MQDPASEPEPAEFLNSSQRRAAWQQLHNGVVEDELCLPCQLATESNSVCSIGTQEWINNGFVGPCGQLKTPLSYCTLCRHIIRAKEYARIKATTTTIQQNHKIDWEEPFIFCHDEGMDLDRETASLEKLEVEKCRNSRSIRRDLVDTERIKSWLDSCETCHIEEGCNNHREGASIEHGDLLLIDVQNDCLAQRKFADRYFTLSYVWGSSRQFLTLKENYQSLQNPGSISAQPISQTIRDSMNLVKSIGEQYLWIDTMCIVQDDLDNKAKAIAEMSAIYSGAVATIVCLSGASADAGLPGVSPTLRNSTAVYIAPGLSVIKRPNLSLDKNEVEYIYVTRAWTFQEQLLSHRNIIFLEEQVYFQCNKELLSEDTHVHSSIDRTYLPTTLESVRLASELNKKRKKPYSPIEEFRWYEEFIPSYTAKQMGYPTDIINAFVGVQTQLGKIFGWTFAEGLPLQLFDIAILWTPIESVVRRITEPPHPSWSWSGWVGRVHYKDILANLDWPGGLNFGKNFRKTAALEFDPNSPAKLDFEGELIPLGAFIVKLSEKNLLNSRAGLRVTPHTLLICEQSGPRCGILHGLQNPDIVSIHAGDYQLLRLSEWQTMLQDRGYHGPYISYLMEDGYGYEHREKLFDEVLRNTPWCTLNVICVQRKGKVWQRVAVGHMHADAWNKAGPVAKKISLK